MPTVPFWPLALAALVLSSSSSSSSEGPCGLTPEEAAAMESALKLRPSAVDGVTRAQVEQFGAAHPDARPGDKDQLVLTDDAGWLSFVALRTVQPTGKPGSYFLTNKQWALWLRFRNCIKPRLTNLPADKPTKPEDCMLDLGSSTSPPDDTTMQELVLQHKPGMALGMYGGAYDGGNWYSVLSGKTGKFHDHVQWLVENNALVRAFLNAAAVTAILALDDRLQAPGWPDMKPGECWSPKAPPPGYDRVDWAALQISMATMRAIATIGAGIKDPSAEIKGVYQGAAGAMYGNWYGNTLATAAAGWTQETWPDERMPPNYPAPFAPDGAGGPDASGVGGAPTVRILQLVSALVYDFLRKFLASSLD